MRKPSRREIDLFKVILFETFIIASTNCFGQSTDSIINKINPQRFSAIVEKKISRLEGKIIAKSEKTLRRLQKQEEKIYRKQLTTKDSLEAKARLAEIQTKYQALQDKLKNP